MTRFVQASTIFSPERDTLRGLHFQTAPHGEVKLVRCTRGAARVTIVDLRPDSPTYTQWLGVELSPENGRLLYVPKGFAQGYQTLVDDTEVAYQMSHEYVPEAASGVRWDDPAFGIEWPPAERAHHLGARSGVARLPGARSGDRQKPRLLQPLRCSQDDRVGQPGPGGDVEQRRAARRSG